MKTDERKNLKWICISKSIISFLFLFLILLLPSCSYAQPLPPSGHIVSYEQFISSNNYAGEYISMSAKIKEIKWSGKGYKYTIQLMPLEEEINKSIDCYIQVKNYYKVIDREEDFIRDETIGIVLKKGYNIVVIGKAGELKEKERVIYVDTKTILHGDTVIPVNDEGTIILLLKNNEYNEIKDDIHPKVVIHPKGEPMQEVTKYTYVITRKVKHNSSADIFAVGSYHKSFLLDYNSELLDRDYDDLFDPIDPYPNHYDVDKDKLSDKEELELGTDPRKNDTDEEGLSDWEEVNKGTDGYITNPLNPDTDGDTLSDYVETHGFEHRGITFFTDPTNPDTDGDGIWDSTDSDPAPIDADEDGLSDTEEEKIGTNIKKKDTDDDGLTDFEEVRGTRGYITDPLKPDTDGDGLLDLEEIKGIKILADEKYSEYERLIGQYGEEYELPLHPFNNIYTSAPTAGKDEKELEELRKKKMAELKNAKEIIERGKKKGELYQLIGIFSLSIFLIVLTIMLIKWRSIAPVNADVKIERKLFGKK